VAVTTVRTTSRRVGQLAAAARSLKDTIRSYRAVEQAHQRIDARARAPPSRGGALPGPPEPSRELAAKLAVDGAEPTDTPPTAGPVAEPSTTVAPATIAPPRTTASGG
jgi:hypothetical protein